jgi:prevent-host-death family protein
MRTPLSSILNPAIIEKLKKNTIQGFFPGIDFNHAMQFILTEGLMPANHLPVQSLIKVESWLRSEASKSQMSYSATDLKNKTGEILDQVIRGNTVILYKHGRAIAEIRPKNDE